MDRYASLMVESEAAGIIRTAMDPTLFQIARPSVGIVIPVLGPLVVDISDIDQLDQDPEMKKRIEELLVIVLPINN